MTDETTPLPPDDEISLLDLLLVVAENARLLVFGPLLAGLVGLGYAFTITPTFTATTRILPPLKSRTVADRLLDRFDLMNIYEQKLRQNARMALEGASKVSSGKDGLIAITEAQQRRVFFEKQLQQAQENLKKAELALGQTGAGESLIRSAPHAMVEGIARLEAQVTTQEVRLATMRGSLTEESPQWQRAQIAVLSALAAGSIHG